MEIFALPNGSRIIHREDYFIRVPIGKTIYRKGKKKSDYNTYPASKEEAESEKKAR